MTAAVTEFHVDRLLVRVFPDRATMGRAAAEFAAAAISSAVSRSGSARVILAAAPSQDTTLSALASLPVPWPSVDAFHMDEYLGLSPDHPASFRRYLRDHLFSLVPLRSTHLIPGEETARPLRTCLQYEDLLLSSPPDLVLAGIGENGHLAFNDPPVADFLDPLLVKLVRLDDACRQQQVHDGCFPTLSSVPTHAYTLTIPALLSAPTLCVVVPGPRKARAVSEALRGPISESCPASVLRRKEGAVLYLDREAAEGVLE